MSTWTLDIIDEQSIERCDLDLSYILHDMFHHVKAFSQIEERVFRGIRRDGHHHLVEHMEAAGDDVGVAMRNRIKSAWVDTDFHACTVWERK